ncbi:MAG: hypothetical protein RIT45_1100 [Pseudomonadota bacterium]|jgi:capsular exopolysaccharide synthesis family protein
MAEVAPEKQPIARPGQAPQEEIPVDFVLRFLREAIIKRIWWLISVATVVITTTVVMTSFMAPVYEATATIMIDSAAPSVLTGVAEVLKLGASNPWRPEGFYAAQRDILLSRSLSQVVVDRHGLATDEHFLGLDKPGVELTEEQRRNVLTTSDAAQSLSGRIIVNVGTENPVARISVRDVDPEYAANLANWVVEAYRDRNLERRRIATNDAYRELRSILRDMELKKERSEQVLLDFETKNNLSENRQAIVAARMTSYDSLYRQAQDQRFRAEQRLRELRKLRDPRDLLNATAPRLEDPLLQRFKERFVDLTLHRAELEGLYLEKHPKLASVDAQLELLLSSARRHLRALVNAAELDVRSAKAAEKNAVKLLDEAKEEDNWMRQALSHRERLRRIRDEDQTFHGIIAKRLAETDLTSQVAVNNVSVLDPAQPPPIPVLPNKRMNYLLGSLLGILLGLIVAVLVEYLDNTVKSRLDVEEDIGVPYLGSVPAYAEREPTEEVPATIDERQMDLYVFLRPNSRAAEAVRSIRTNLIFMRPDNPPSCILVTSPSPRDGKTSSTVALGCTLAAASGSVVIVDTDLRKPRLSRIFDLNSSVGVTSFVLNRNCDVHQITQRTEVSGLDFVASGALPPNASEVLHTERFAELVRQLRKTYRYVLLDSPPVLLVSDAQILASLVDSVVVVAQAKATRKQALREALRLLRSVSADVLGVVLSRADQPVSGYGYYYGKGYKLKGTRYAHRIPQKPSENEA